MQLADKVFNVGRDSPFFFFLPRFKLKNFRDSSAIVPPRLRFQTKPLENRGFIVM